MQFTVPTSTPAWVMPESPTRTDPEVQDLQHAVGVDHQVRRLDVPVDEAGAVRVGQPVGELLEQLQAAGERQPRAVANQLRERFTRRGTPWR